MLIGLLGPAVASDCRPIHEADQHIGETKCVTGKVLRVNVGAKGVYFLDFCEDQLACPFTVVVFSPDLKDVGDRRRLAGRIIEIKGPVKLYDGRAEIIFNPISQIEGGAAMIPPPAQKLRRGEPRPLQCRTPAADEEAGENQGTANTSATYGNDVEDEPR